MNRTDISYGNNIGQIKLMLRFSLLNFFRASCLDAKREYIRLTKG